MSSPRDFEALGGETVWQGRLFQVRRERFRFVDGEEVEREFVRHGGAVGIVVHDDAHVWLVRQPREAVGDPDMLEIPAGRRDVEGEEPLATAQRELAEEIGRGADTWEPIRSYHSSVGFTTERVDLFRATDLRAAEAESGENERIEIVAWPLDRLDEAIAATTDAKTIIGLGWLRERLADGPAAR
jgi:8-oxo-dGTP pyrophosphatase MutT (NUDIX family)